MVSLETSFLNVEIFGTLLEVQVLVERWRKHIRYGGSAKRA